MKSFLKNPLRFLIILVVFFSAQLSFAQDVNAGMDYKQVADMMHTIMEANRTVYAETIVNRLQNEEKVIRASEKWKENKSLVLPAQMFRLGAEKARETNKDFSYSLLSIWPINKNNGAKTPAEKEGLEAVVKDPTKAYYTQETVNGKLYFTAIYADKAVSQACVQCHNNHQDSPRYDFRLNDVMGGVVLRIPVKQ